MQIPTEILTYIQKQWKWDNDLAQDILVDIMELPDGSTINKSWCVSRYVSRRINQSLKEENRRRLEEDNHASIKEYCTGDDGAGADPLDILIMDEEMTERFKGLSPLLSNTLYEVVVLGTMPEEVAEAHGVSANVIYKRVHDAKQILEGNK